MWGLFAVAAMLQTALILVPGYLLLRAFGVRPIMSLMLAAPLSTALYFLWVEILVKVGVFCDFVSVFLPIAALTAVVYFAGRFWRRTGSPLLMEDGLEQTGESGCVRGAGKPLGRSRRRSWLLLLLFVAVGIVVGIYVLVLPFGDPTNFVQEIDNKSHLALLRSFTETGNWSSFDGGFYPCGWHVLGALVSDVLHTDYALIENALDFAFACIVFPAGMMAMLSVLTRGSTKTLFYGAILSSAFTVFPWGIIHFGPLMPNMGAYCVFPAMAVLFMEWVELLSAKQGRKRRTAALLLALIGSLSLHPNSLFAAIVFFVPYCVQRIYGLGGTLRRHGRNLALCLAFLVVVAAVWYMFFRMPFMQSTVNHFWGPIYGVRQATINVFLLNMPDRGMQLVLAALVIGGGVWALTQRRYRWIPFAYAAFCFLFVLAAATAGPLKQLLTGFWYTDKFRICACMALAGIPLTALGAATFDGWVRKRFKGLDPRQPLGIALTCVAVLVLVLAVYAPQRAMSGTYQDSDFYSFDKLRWGLHNNTNGAEIIYEDEERAFVQKVVDLVGDDLVINSVDDGSLFAYGMDGLNTYYRQASGMTREITEDNSDEPTESLIVRAQLNDIATDVEVQEAVRRMGAHYVVLLDADNLENQQWHLAGYSKMKYPGIDAVNDSTPGFTIVLAEGDMRLYSIDAA